jgi:hypothetical protein
MCGRVFLTEYMRSFKMRESGIEVPRNDQSSRLAKFRVVCVTQLRVHQATPGARDEIQSIIVCAPALHRQKKGDATRAQCSTAAIRIGAGADSASITNLP